MGAAIPLFALLCLLAPLYPGCGELHSLSCQGKGGRCVMECKENQTRMGYCIFGFWKCCRNRIPKKSDCELKGGQCQEYCEATQIDTGNCSHTLRECCLD